MSSISVRFDLAASPTRARDLLAPSVWERLQQFGNDMTQSEFCIPISKAKSIETRQG
jgi:hypothetical protein